MEPAKRIRPVHPRGYRSALETSWYEIADCKAGPVKAAAVSTRFVEVENMKLFWEHNRRNYIDYLVQHQVLDL